MAPRRLACRSILSAPPELFVKALSKTKYLWNTSCNIRLVCHRAWIRFGKLRSGLEANPNRILQQITLEVDISQCNKLAQRRDKILRRFHARQFGSNVNPLPSALRHYHYLKYQY